MSDPTRRTRVRYATVALAALIPLGVGGCGAGLFSSGAEATPSGNTDEENEALAADLQDQIAEALPEVSVQLVNYSDDITVPATLAISVRVPDPAAAVVAAAGSPVPDWPDLTDPTRPLAPVAAQIAQLAWLSEIDPIGDLRINLDDETDLQGGDSWSLGISGPETSAAFEAAFGPRPG